MGESATNSPLIFLTANHDERLNESALSTFLPFAVNNAKNSAAKPDRPAGISNAYRIPDAMPDNQFVEIGLGGFGVVDRAPHAGYQIEPLAVE